MAKSPKIIKGVPYMGSKYKLAPVIFDIIRKENPTANVFVDVFTGGGSMAYNAACVHGWQTVVANDIDAEMIALHRFLANPVNNEEAENMFLAWFSREERKSLLCASGTPLHLRAYLKTVWSFGNCSTGEVPSYLYGKSIEPYKRAAHALFAHGDASEWQSYGFPVPEFSVEADGTLAAATTRRLELRRFVVLPEVLPLIDARFNVIKESKIGTKRTDSTTLPEQAQQAKQAQAFIGAEQIYKTQKAERAQQASQVERAEQVNQIQQAQRVKQVKQAQNAEHSEQAQHVQEARQAQQVQNVERAEHVQRVHQASQHSLIKWCSLDFSKIPLIQDAVYYLDPPYKDTCGYGNTKFDYARFAEWALWLSEHKPVYISEKALDLPGFEVIHEWKPKTECFYDGRAEKLYARTDRETRAN